MLWLQDYCLSLAFVCLFGIIKRLQLSKEVDNNKCQPEKCCFPSGLATYLIVDNCWCTPSKKVIIVYNIKLLFCISLKPILILFYVTRVQEAKILICWILEMNSCALFNTRLLTVKRHEHHVIWKSCWTP